MLWIFNKELLNNDIIFNQIFDTNNIFNYNDNIVYNLENNIIIQDFKDYNNLKINYEIKIIGNIIMYRNLNNNEILTFLKKESICESENLILTYKYNLIENTRMPQLSSYDYYYADMEFNIYYKNNTDLFIIQINKSNNSSTNYWIKQQIVN